MLLTAYEISKKYGLSASHLRRLIRDGLLAGRKAKISDSSWIWLIDRDSVRRYKATKPRPGRKPLKKSTK